ncbi:phosphotransferase [Mesobacillus zeae]|nr:phosphotransferase [Mesobacillus zeae]
MNIKFHSRRDDRFLDRLFSYLNTVLPFKVNSLVPIRADVYLAETKGIFFILKGFASLPKMEVQRRFADSLRKSGFTHSYLFYTFTREHLFFEGLYYSPIQYIEPDSTPFTFLTENERTEGMSLLDDYHVCAKQLVGEYKGMLSQMELSVKWKERANRFRKNLPTIGKFISKRKLNDIRDWAKESLEGLAVHAKRLESKEETILHCDVAHHNFHRARNGELFLIDFDLLSIGPPQYDLLQYAGRILPYMDWSFVSLSKMKHLQKELDDPFFLYGLLFPSDIMREWNRILKDRMDFHPKRMSHLIDMTEQQFSKRREFVNVVRSYLH